MSVYERLASGSQHRTSKTHAAVSGKAISFAIRCIRIGRDEAITLVNWQNEKHLVFKSNVSPLKSGGREGIRTPGLLVANRGKNKLRQGATIT